MPATGTLWAAGTPATAVSGAGSWATAASAAGTNDAAFAVFTSATSAETGTIKPTGYGAQTAIGAQPASVDSVAVTVYSFEATTSRWTSVTAQLFDGATPLGSSQGLTLSATSTNSQTLTFTGVATWANLASLTINIIATKSGSVSSSFSVDAVGVVVNYSLVQSRGVQARNLTLPGKPWKARFTFPYTARRTPPTPVIPVAGANLGAPWAQFNAGLGPVSGFRGYAYPGSALPAAWPGPDCPVPPGIPASGTVISIVPDIGQTLAGTLDTALAAYFATVPAGAYITAWHEGEIFAQQAGYSQAQLIAMHARLYGLFSSNAPASASYGQIVAAASAISGSTGYPLGPWMSTAANGGIVLDFYGIDMGNYGPTTTFAGEIGNAIAAMTAAGVPASGPWTLTEVSYNPSWLGSKNQWYSDGWAVARAIGAIHFLFFGSAGDLWPPANASVMPVLQDIAALSRGDARSAAASVPARSTQAPWASSSSTASLTATFTSNPAAGSKVLVTIQTTSTAGLAVTDNGTTPAVFSLDACCLNTSGSIPSVFVYRADNITLPGAGTYAVSVTQTPAAALQVAASAYTGLQNGPPTSTSAVTSSGNNPAVNPVTPSDVSSLFFSAFSCTSANNPESMCAASGEFTLQQVQSSGSGNFPAAVADALVTSPAPRQGGWTLPDTPSWSAVMAAYGAMPANVQIVPGAEMTWAQAPVPKAGVTAVAGLASASGAALPVFPGVNAGLASASGWSAVNAAGADANPAAGLPAAAGAAASGTVTVTVAAGVAAATGAVPFAPGGTISLTLTAINPVGAAGAAPGATVTTATTAPAGLPAAAGAAAQPAATVAPAAAGAAAAGTAAAPAATVAPAAGTAPASGAALQPAGHTAGLASASAAAQQAGGQNAALASAAGAALNATVTTSGTTNASAGLAAATGAALTPAVTVAPAAATAPAAGTPPAAAAAGSIPAGLPSASAAALQAGGQNAALAAATGTALQPTVVTGTAPAAGLAAGTGAAQQPAVTIAPAAGTGAGTGAAPQPAMANPAAAAGTGAALQPSGHTTGPAPAAAAAQAPAVTVTAAAGLASAAGAAAQPTVVTGVAPAAGLASAAGTALQPAVTITFTAATAAGTGAGLPAVHGINAGLAAAAGTAPAPSLTALASAAAAQALAAALNPTATSAAAFTVGILTATDQRTGGPA